MMNCLFKKISGFLFLLVLFFSRVQLGAQPFEYGLPLLSRSQLGIYSPLATAAGETILSQVGPQAAFLNPGVLGLTENFQLAISGRFMVSSIGTSYNYENKWVTYNRETLNPDFAGLVFGFGAWRLAIGYSLLEEFNRPEIPYYDNASVTQSGKLHAFQFGLGRRVNDRFSLGLSLNFRKGSLNHLDLNYYNLRESYYQNDLTGFNWQFGFVWSVNRTLTLALVIRPEYRMKVEEKMEIGDSETGFIYYSSEFKTYFRFPLALCLSSRINISESLDLYSDLAYWNWRQFSGGNHYLEEVWRVYHWPLEKDSIKFSAGFDHSWKLGEGGGRTLHLLAGYLHDSYSFLGISDYLTCGLSLGLKKISLAGSVRLPLARVRDSDALASSTFQLGLNFGL